MYPAGRQETPRVSRGLFSWRPPRAERPAGQGTDDSRRARREGEAREAGQGQQDAEHRRPAL